MCTAVLIGWETPRPPPYPLHLGSYTRALLVSQDVNDISLWPPSLEDFTCKIKNSVKENLQNRISGFQRQTENLIAVIVDHKNLIQRKRITGLLQEFRKYLCPTKSAGKDRIWWYIEMKNRNERIQWHWIAKIPQSLSLLMDVKANIFTHFSTKSTLQNNHNL
jgi:hypothetical protein